jgi:hypothetical protein
VKEAATTLRGVARPADGLKDSVWYEMEGDWDLIRSHNEPQRLEFIGTTLSIDTVVLFKYTLTCNVSLTMGSITLNHDTLLPFPSRDLPMKPMTDASSSSVSVISVDDSPTLVVRPSVRVSNG